MCRKRKNLYSKENLYIAKKNDIHCESPLQIYKNKRKLPKKNVDLKLECQMKTQQQNCQLMSLFCKYAKKCYLTFG